MTTLEITDMTELNNLKNLEDVPNIDLTPIQQFYSGANVFITGGTGFLGRILIEKLIRSCPTISTLYILVRSKKGKNLHSRIDELFDDCIFDRLKQECPKFRHKVVGVAGDCSLPDLGLGLQDRKTLIDEVNVVFHVAATVRFDEKLKLATEINVRSPQDIISLSKEMTNLKVLIHVSTAYANCPNNYIEEKIYAPPINPKKMLALVESMPEKHLDSITPAIIGDWPNTYAFTKCIAEDMVKQDGQNMPIGIFRPSIVISTYQEPIPSWINNMYGPTGIAAGAGVGLIHILHCDKDKNANIVPVDMCVNTLISCAKEVHEMYELTKKDEKTFEIPVYNYESSNDNPINWGHFMHLSGKYGVNYPTVKAIWCYTFKLEKIYPLYLFYVLVLHFLPALLVDTALLCVGKAPRMIKAYKKVFKFSSVISYFSNRNWKFQSDRVPNMISKMSEKDKQIFFCDLKKLEWEKFFEVYLKGVRTYLLQDPLDSLPEAKNRYRKFELAHKGMKLVFAFLFLKLVWIMLTYVVSSINV